MRTSLLDNYSTVLRDIKSKDTHDLNKKYKIEVNTDGTVYDTKRHVLYNNLNEWCILVTERPEYLY